MSVPVSSPVDSAERASPPKRSPLPAIVAFVVGAGLAGGIAWVAAPRHDPRPAPKAAAKALPDWSGLWVVQRDPKAPFGKGDAPWNP
ncbi:MAG: hypothetical protein RLZZ450_3597 [Pseudomonadota bacterium]|jgi:hypothetical protein